MLARSRKYAVHARSDRRRGIPTVTVFSTVFARAARNQAEGRGMRALHLVTVPHPMHTAPRAVVAERADKAVESIVGRLTREFVEETNGVATLAAMTAVDDDHELFFERGRTDGLPVVMPTAEKVARMVAAAGRPAEEIIGPIPPRWRKATIEKIAINAVMAGCRPEYFPVGLTAIDALLDPDCQLYGIQTATNTTTPLIVVNGPIADELEINSGGNRLGAGGRANATIGRAVQLVLRNIGCDFARHTDLATHSQSRKFTFFIAT